MCKVLLSRITVLLSAALFCGVSHAGFFDRSDFLLQEDHVFTSRTMDSMRYTNGAIDETVSSFPSVEELRALRRSAQHRQAVQELNMTKAMRCSYKDSRKRVYLWFWQEEPAVSLAKLYSIQPNHPALFMGPAMSNCPDSLKDAQKLVANQLQLARTEHEGEVAEKNAVTLALGETHGTELSAYSAMHHRCTMIPVGTRSRTEFRCADFELKGVKVGRLSTDSSLYLAGLRSGDIISEFRDYGARSRTSPIVDPTAFLQKIDGLGVRDALYVGYRIPLEKESHSSHWERVKYTRITRSDGVTAKVATQTRTHSPDEILAVEKRSYESKRLMSGIGLTAVRTDSYEVSPLSDIELSRRDPATAISKKEMCLANGAYPYLPELSYPKGYQPKTKLSYISNGGFDPDGGIGDHARNAINSIGDARRILAETAGALSSSRRAFWNKLDNTGQDDPQLRHEYAFWLQQGSRLGSQLSAMRHGPLGVFGDLVRAGGQADDLSYRTSPAAARDAVQFLVFSACSPINSNYTPEAIAGDMWLRHDNEARLDYYDFEHWMAAAETNIEYRKQNPASDIDVARSCAREALTDKQPIDQCLSDSPLNLVKTSETSFEHTYNPQEDGLATLIVQQAGAIKHCKPGDHEWVSRYLLYANAKEYLSNYRVNRLYPELCGTTDFDLQSDEVAQYISKSVARGHLKDNFWSDLDSVRE